MRTVFRTMYPRSKTAHLRSALSTGAVVDAALAIVDDEGLDALTMRRLADDLDVGVMTLYRHVRTKEELLNLLVERVLDELVIPSEGSWDERLVELFTNGRGLLLRHPSVVYIDSIQPAMGLSALRSLDAALGMLRAGGIDGTNAVTAMSTLVNFTFGSAKFRFNPSGQGRADYELHIRGAAPDLLPNISELVPEMLERGRDEEFVTGLRLIVESLPRLRKELRTE